MTVAAETTRPLAGTGADLTSASDFASIYRREFNYVWCSLRRLGIGEREIEDVTHDVFLTAHRRLPTYDRTRPLRPWLFGIAFRVASDHRRLARNAREIATEGIDSVDPARPPDDEVAGRQARALVRQAICALDLNRRAVLIMHDIEGYPVPEIAEALSVPLKTMYSRLRSARELFTAEVRRLQADGAPARRRHP